ncbi:MAG TPA: hypothetical protein VME92_16060 [Acetobacteraceae bacterium]|nr:hypothetical protein [Acetobacteraceae bacterium]
MGVGASFAPISRAMESAEAEGMMMRRALGLAMAGLLAVGFAARAGAVERQRVRGEITSVEPDAVAIRTYEGTTEHLTLGVHTHYIAVVPATLSDIHPGDFVGIGATGSDAAPVALEVVIFPASMRGTGEGHYPWSVPAAVADADRHRAASGAGAATVQGTMTNGTVTAAAPPVQGSMTNGTVAASAAHAGGETLTVTYKGGKTPILVPAEAPVVRLQPGSQSLLTQGAKVFAVASGTGPQPVALFIAVGQNGLMPPM